ncbi:helix-turn-helix transcriptional regulator [Cohnella abietis]|uniref:Putative HTH-type transcriptional regulator YobV n=1 Tax=Cohnella abietis TaxID=2507935 RepID=A0A3T1D4T0_9BACL|nr:YafY family protein [Cohnella abietis]BBI33019.1 putative HTH-type transcriptional regulator YobV [Cohnella abietis]
MKLDRLLAIVIMLVNRRMIQAKELADHFEVSVRTIYRDIDVINQAGIPVISYQGAGGGIGLSDGYRLDRNVLTNNELVAIVTALQSVSTTHGSSSNKQLLEKMQSIVPAAESEQFQFQTQQFIVDMSPWGRQGPMEEKLAQLKTAVEKGFEITFTYCNAQGEVTKRSVEPHTLVLKKQSWYLYAFCLERQQFRLFKLFRMKDIEDQKRSFVRKNVSVEQIPWNEEWSSPEKTTTLRLRFHQRAKHIAEEWFGIEALNIEASGENSEKEARYIVSVHYPEDRWLYGFILSFGQDVEVLEPEHIRGKIKEIAASIQQMYK